MEDLRPYPIPEGWTVYLPADYGPDPEAEPPMWRFCRESRDFTVYCTAWTVSDGSAPAGAGRLLELFEAAAQSAAGSLTEADLSLYAPPGFSVTAWQGRTLEGLRMTVFAIGAPGHLLAVYLVGNSLSRREELLNCVRLIARN